MLVTDWLILAGDRSLISGVGVSYKQCKVYNIYYNYKSLFLLGAVVQTLLASFTTLLVSISDDVFTGWLSTTLNDWTREGILSTLPLLLASGESPFGDLRHPECPWLDIGNGEFSGGVTLACLGD